MFFKKEKIKVMCKQKGIELLDINMPASASVLPMAITPCPPKPAIIISLVMVQPSCVISL